MTEISQVSPAEEAANRAITETFAALSSKSNFRVEAGAGAGKTYSLVKALNHLIQEQGDFLLKQNAQIACITYTEVARDQIRKRIDNNPVVLAETIHAFSWGLIQNFQNSLRELIPDLNDNWKERIEETPIQNQKIIYSLGYPKITADEIYLHHDDVISLITKLLYLKKFQNVLGSKFPIIFIDEYQDTNKDLAKALLENFIEKKVGPHIGLFGDHWQKIYDRKTCGLISANDDKLKVIGKNANFRSDKLIVEMLNRMRPDLLQNVSDPESKGEIIVFHTNEWNGQRRTENHWQEDLPAELARKCFQKTLTELRKKEWNMNFPDAKILFLTNNLLASEQGYSNIANAFEYSDDFLKKNDSYIEYFADVLEPTCKFFTEKNYGEMFKLLNIRTIGINSHTDKISWKRDMIRLIEARENQTIGEVLEIIKETNRPRLSSRVEDREKRLHELIDVEPDKLDDSDKNFISKIKNLKSIQYKEVIKLVNYINDNTPFSTKHGVKGEQFENVIIVLGRGWNNYNWNQMLEWMNDGVPSGRQESFERNRNLFYVCCSRPKHKLCLLFTQKLSDKALSVLAHIFGKDSLIPIKDFN